MKFETAVPIGSGATGEVFEAWDPRLQRRVALKLLRRSDPDSLERMQREARAQARIDHPNVCRVYDVGERDGRPFIAMQLVEGDPLDEAARDLPLEQKVALVADVAEGMQAAHAAGLVHRDLKPANILVERDEDGGLRPVVVDFGIAREASSEGLTVTGQLLGTPAYMSPEQVRGDIRCLDRRSDVFSLGVMLWELLAGRHPFAADGAVQTMVAITDEEAPRLRRVAPSVPEDLAAVTEKCLEKDLDRRYQSAAALAEDLRRFLDGRPVSARTTGSLDRLHKRVRRHPLTSGLLAVSAAVVLVASSLALHARITAAQRAQLAQEFGRSVERAESILRMGHLSPAHDLAAERALVEDELDRIRETMEDAGRPARGPGLYALGRGALTLGRPEEARRSLEEAREVGFDEPPVRLALGRAHLDLLDRALVAADQLPTPTAREAARTRAREQHATIARSLIGTSGPGPTTTATERQILEARLALASEDWDHARAEGLASSEELDWMYEGLLVAAEADLRYAARVLDRSLQEDVAHRLERALSVLGRASERAPSDPEIHVAHCRHWRLELDRLFGGSDVEEPYRNALESCDTALLVAPAHAGALSAKSYVAWRFGRWLRAQGRDPTAALEIATDSARRLTEAGHRAEGLLHLGNVAVTRADWAAESGDASASRDLMAEAIDRFEEAARENPASPLLHMNLSRAWRGVATADWGSDWETALRRSIASANRGLALDTGSQVDLLTSRCQSEGDLAYRRLLEGRDPEGHATLALESCAAALELDPDHRHALNSLAISRWILADQLIAEGRDAREALTDTARDFALVLEAIPAYHPAQVNRGTVLLSLAEERLERGGDPLEGLAAVEEHANAIRDVYPIDFRYHQTRLALVRARVARSRGRDNDTERFFQQARDHGRLLVEGWPTPPTNPTLAAQVDRREADWRLARDQPERALRLAHSAIAYAEAALDQNDDLVDAWREVALASAVAAAALGDGDGSRSWRERARAAARRFEDLSLWTPPEISILLEGEGPAEGNASTS